MFSAGCRKKADTHPPIYTTLRGWLFLVARPLHLGLEPILTRGQAADVGMSSIVSFHIGLVDLLVVLLHVSQE